ncbi:MAG: prephenate dehydrogenase/arogenate dehydrogenase family protein [Thiotrichaceae bacterium]
MINRLCIFGVGLIGGSLAMALRKAGYCNDIIGCSRNEVHLLEALELGVIDEFTTDPVDAVNNADVIFLAVPLSAIKPILEHIKDHLPEHAIITDGGSAKGCVKQDAEDVFGSLPARFILGHPIAGREKSGVNAAIDDLYQQRKVILTPTDHTDPEALSAIQRMWETAGAAVEHLGVEEHDQILAATSHLPHVLAFELVSTLSNSAVSDNVFNYAAGGFQDFTRIASSDPVMWRDICLHNKEAILGMLGEFEERLDELKTQIIEADGKAILETFAAAKAARDDAVK